MWQREGEKDGHRVTERWVEALLSRCVNVIRGGNGGRKVGGGNLLQQRYLPNAWSRNANTAAVMTEGPGKTEKKRRLVTNQVMMRPETCWERQKCWQNVVTIQDSHIQTTKPARVVFPCSANRPNPGKCFTKTTPKGRTDNTSRAAAQYLADFKGILGDSEALRCRPPPQRRWRVSHWPRWILFMLFF